MLALVTGRSEAMLKDENLSGTHWMRNLCGDVTTYYGWPEKDADILGDWATPADGGDGDGPPTKRTRKGSKAPKSTRQKFYRANSPQDEQIEVRTRFYKAVAAALQNYGIGKLEWETTWRDLIPEKDAADVSMHPFYGPRPGHAT